MTTWTGVRADILRHFEDNWDFETYPVQYQNKDTLKFGSKSSPLNLKDDGLKGYVRVSIEPVLQNQFEFSSGTNTRFTGYFIMMVMRRKNEGTLYFHEVYDQLGELFLNKNIGDARFTNLQANAYVYEDNFVTQTLTMNLTFENIQ